MRKFSIFQAGLLAVFSISSCSTFYQPQSVQYKDYRITKAIKPDSAVLMLMKPYADSVNKSMNNVIAIAEIELVKDQPEGTLGNVLADAMLAISRQKFGEEVHAAFINSGGVRLTAIPAGPITRGKLFEVAPFDNIMVLQKMSGVVLQEFLDNVSSRGGWPTAGISWQIKNKKAINVRIGGKPLEASTIYTIVNNDYVANGGDEMDMLRNLPQVNKGYLYRDAVIEYFTLLNSQGKKITSKIENRISNAE